MNEQQYEFYYKTNGLIYGLRIMGIICLVASIASFFTPFMGTSVKHCPTDYCGHLWRG
ncbi:MAG: hypothetical protein Q7U35_05590 [Methanobacteriaceae archaeon]|nr:hypothetical protein [Methanobacteriaceae archaeon]MDP2836592.1 hypothetical protein [Methanobacteriaceae archaeon]MDP3034422.1 hypothetical protein [Methanobacteriaceae archaeon]MDP3485545.1 hypothetical protein [Methanobacteriaceae archaeon]MDP3624017.1 hypothetical protein [Methanobacteriaceae archaeon]